MKTWMIRYCYVNIKKDSKKEGNRKISISSFIMKAYVWENLNFWLKSSLAVGKPKFKVDKYSDEFFSRSKREN